MIAAQMADKVPIPSYGLGVDWHSLFRFLSPMDWIGIITVLLFLLVVMANDPVFADDEFLPRKLTALLAFLIGSTIGLTVSLIRVGARL